MRKPIALVMLVLLSLAAAGRVAAHGGKSHRLLGTVEELHESHLTVTDQEGREHQVVLTADTAYERGGKAAKRSDLVAGVRVVVMLDEDDKTALKIKLSPAPNGTDEP